MSSPLLCAAAGKVIATAALLPAADLAAQTYPSRPVRLVAAFTAGSSTDTIARALAVRLSLAKRLRAIGITSRNVNPLLPDVPPVANTLPGYEMTSFAGIAAPGATPRAIITRLNREVNALLTLEDIRRPLLDAGGTIEPIDPVGMDRYIAGEIERWRRIAQTRGISIR